MLKKAILPVFTLCLVTLIIAGCETERIGNSASPEPPSAVASCQGCHTNYEYLKQVHSPDTAAAGGGCGGETPHIEPYDRVYLGGAGYTAFKASTHGQLPCVGCHGGNDKTADKKIAHSGNFISHPSTNADLKCAGCHADIVARTKNSLHEQGWGQKAMVYGRSGVGSFEELSDMMKMGYDKNCAKCHATCGDCHINRPKAGGGGLLNGHNFNRTPDMTDNCVTCHTSRGGHAYLGIGPNTVPDVHLTKQGFTCMSCHSKNEIHGDRNTYNHRYQMALMPSCDDCHTSMNNANMYHSVHINTFNCNTCHSQDYNNCGSCHIGGEGARVVSHMKFKIGMNPIQTVRPYKLATLRQSLSAPDSWKEYGTAALANFNSQPTYKYTTPHNTIRWTSRTKVDSGKACYDNCHIIKEGTTFRNKQLYLFQSDLESWEVPANTNIVVDGKLPASWGLSK